jgi:hypothetical protein
MTEATNITRTMPSATTPAVPKAEEAALIDLATKIKAAHEAIGAAFKGAPNHAFAAGALLNQAKEKLDQHGQWLPWLQQNCPNISERTAQLYMKLARGRAAIEAKAQSLADLTLNEAAKLIDAPGAPASPDSGPTSTSAAATTSTTGQSGGKTSTLTPADRYDNAEKKLIDRLKELTPETAVTCITATIKLLNATAATMKEAVKKAA